MSNGQWDIPPMLAPLRGIVPDKSHFDDFAVAHDFPQIGPRIMLLNARKLYRLGNRTVLLALAIEDITERRQRETQLAVLHRRDRLIASCSSRPVRTPCPDWR